MSDDKQGLGRRDLLTLGGGGILGAAAGYLFGRQPSPPPAAVAVNGPAPGAGARKGYPFSLTVQGGYGWLFSGGKVTLMTLKKESCSCEPYFAEHHMMLITSDRFVEVDKSTTYPAKSDGMGNSTWMLTGATKFIQGMPGAGITERHGTTDWAKLADPYGPGDPDDDPSWNDALWLPTREKAKANAITLASNTFELTDGDLTVCRPRNPQAVVGRWVFKDKGGNERKKALTDVLNLTVNVVELVVGIETTMADGKTGTIVLKPVSGGAFLPVSLRHEAKLVSLPLSDGVPLPHLAMLYDFVKDQQCADAIVPTYLKRTDLPNEPPKGRTPGDLCPPLMLDL